MDLWLAQRRASPFYLLAPVRDAARNQEKGRMSPVEARSTCLLDSGSIVLRSTQSAVGAEESGGVGEGWGWGGGGVGVRWGCGGGRTMSF